MKFWRSFVTVVGVLLFSSSLFFVQPAQAVDFNTIVQATPHILAEAEGRRNAADDLLTTEFGQKIDLNNSDIRDFRELRGFYPKLASLIIQNAPYDNVEDVLSIPGLSDAQKGRLESNLEKFSAAPPEDVFIEGDERYNAGIY